MCQRLGMLRAKRAGKFENEFKMVKAFVKEYASNNQIKIVKVLVGRKPNPDPMFVPYAHAQRTRIYDLLCMNNYTVNVHTT